MAHRAGHDPPGRQGTRSEPGRPHRSGAAPRPAVGAVLGLQRRAGNAAVTWLVRESRRVLQRQPKRDGPVMHTFVIGRDVSAEFAEEAKRLAKDGRVTPAELSPLRKLALKWRTTSKEPEGSVGDAERMFMAGLLDPANATLVGKANVTSGARVTLSFAPGRTTADNLRAAADVDRPTRSRDVAEALADYDALNPLDVVNRGVAWAIAQHWAKEQIVALAGPAHQQTAKDVMAFAFFERLVGPTDVLDAMLAAGSDSTPLDMLAAGAVYAIAASARHPLAGDLLAGRIKVDAVTKTPAPANHPGSAAAYVSHGGGGREKGDTLYVSTKLNILNLNDRSLVIHELEHAAHDKERHSGGLAEEELSAYRAQARYALEQIESGGDRATAIEQIAAEWNLGLVCGSVLVSATTRLEPLVREINSKSKVPGKPSPRQLHEWFVEEAKGDFLAHAITMLRDEYKIPKGATTAFEGLRGESLLQAGKP